jgi:acetyl-CoA C-acetyltransferase
MPKRIAIVAVAQTKHGGAISYTIREMVYEVAFQVLQKTGLRREDLGTIITASSDFWQGTGCSDSLHYDAAGAYLKSSPKVDEDSALAFMYAFMRMLSGHYETALVVGVTKGSEIPSPRTLTHLYTDPFFQRPIGLEDAAAAAMQAQLLLAKSSIHEEQMARVTVKNLGNALQNPLAHRRKKLTVDEVLASPILAYPLRELHCAPSSDGACAVLLATEERAPKLSPKPVWIEGAAWGSDGAHFGDRDLLRGPLRKVAHKAYQMAGITDPPKEISVAEICEPFASQELLWYEELGFCGKGEAGKLLDQGTTEMEGALPVNPSGGVLSTNPYVARGLIRIGEAALQLMGQAGHHQVSRARTALAHSVHGLAGQVHSVLILKG